MRDHFHLPPETYKDLLDQYGALVKERTRTFSGKCPLCESTDKFSVLKSNGWAVCYRGSCLFGKRPFWGWLALAKGITEAQAKQELFYGEKQHTLDPIRFKLSTENPDRLKPLAWPEMLYATWECEGRDYLLSRGVTPQQIEKYKIGYDSTQRRVVLPITIDGQLYGWQGRAIDKVEDGFRMRNNLGFRRDLLVMFYDNIEENGHVILTEGPFDAMKFELCGGAVANMGKAVADKQIDLILEKNPKKFYLALDDDAAKEENELVEKLHGVEIYKISVPIVTKKRCEQLGKKADFGECSFEECLQAFRDATRVRKNQIFLKLL